MTDPVSTPAARLISRFGAEALARWSGRHRTRVHAWSWPISKGGTGGVVPLRVRAAIINGARNEGHEVTYADFELATGEGWLADEDVLPEGAVA